MSVRELGASWSLDAHLDKNIRTDYRRDDPKRPNGKKRAADETRFLTLSPPRSEPEPDVVFHDKRKEDRKKKRKVGVENKKLEDDFSSKRTPSTAEEVAPDQPLDDLSEVLDREYFQTFVESSAIFRPSSLVISLVSIPLHPFLVSLGYFCKEFRSLILGCCKRISM